MSSHPHGAPPTEPFIPESDLQPGPDGLYRDCVYEIPSLDALGRRRFVAVNRDACTLDETTAVTDEEIERVRARLWQVVREARLYGLKVLK